MFGIRCACELLVTPYGMRIVNNKPTEPSLLAVRYSQGRLFAIILVLTEQ